MAWSDVYAFCIWDGGFLPSEAEWNFAAAGGGSSTGQRVFPWSRPPTDTTANCTLANYQNGNSTSCFPEGVNDVGSESPAGDDAFGQSDMAGNIYEWVLDWSADYVTPCDDCVSVPAVEDVLGAVPGRVFRGGGAAGVKSRMLTSYRFAAPADSRISYVGARCARAP